MTYRTVPALRMTTVTIGATADEAAVSLLNGGWCRLQLAELRSLPTPTKTMYQYAQRSPIGCRYRFFDSEEAWIMYYEAVKSAFGCFPLDPPPRVGGWRLRPYYLGRQGSSSWKP